jgi:hypothetical protein
MPEKDRYIDERAARPPALRARRSGTQVGNERRRSSRALGRWPLTAITSLTAPSSEQPVARLRATSSADGRQWCRRPPTDCSVAGLTPLTRRDIGVVPGLGPGRLQLPSHELSPSLGWSLRCASGCGLAAAGRQANTDRGVAARSRTTRPFQQRTARRGRAGMAPTPAACPSPPGWATLGGWGARWAWTQRPRRQAVGLVQQERQP